MDTQEQSSFWTDEPEAPARLLPLGEQVGNLEAELRNAQRQVGRLEATVEMLRKDNGSNIDAGTYWYEKWRAERDSAVKATQERDEALRKLGAKQSMGVFSDARVAALEMDLAYEMNARVDLERKLEETQENSYFFENDRERLFAEIKKLKESLGNERVVRLEAERKLFELVHA